MTLHVVTVVRDDPQGLVDTLTSVHSKFPRTPIYVKLPSTTDSAYRVARDWQTSHNVTIDASQDFGPYDAMNKALAGIPSHSVVWFLNAGDVVSPNCDAGLILNICSDPSFVWGFGQYTVQGLAGSLRPSPMPSYSSRDHARFRIPVCHQAVLARSSSLQSMGAFDTAFKIAADYKLLLALGTAHKPQLIATHMIDYRPGGISDRFPLKTVWEQRLALRQLQGTIATRPNFALDLARVCRWHGHLAVRKLRDLRTSPKVGH